MSRRLNKINQLLKEELSKLIQEGTEEEIVTLTMVETSPDLKQSKIWISVLGDKPEKVLLKLQEKAGIFQSFLGQKLFIRQIPKLIFIMDKNQERIAEIEKLLE